MSKESKQIEVTVSLCMSKTFTIDVDDYIVEGVDIDEDGYKSEIIDYSECDLYDAVDRQLLLPHQVGEELKHLANSHTKYQEIDKGIIKDLSGWILDDYEIVLDD